MKVLVLLILVFLTFGSTAFSDWMIEAVDGGGLHNPSLTLNSAGYPCIAYPVEGTGVKYAEWDGSQWLIECAYSLAFPSYLWFVSLALDAEDTPHISFAFGSLFYLTQNESMEWQTEEVQSGGNTSHTSLALDGDGYPHIAYCHEYGDAIGYATFSGSTWNIEYLDAGNNTGWFLSLELDADDNPHISYTRKYPHSLMYASGNGSGVWSFQEIDLLSEQCLNTSLALSGEGIPHISYNAEDEVRYTYWTGSQWHIETLDACDSGSFGWGTSIVLDSDDFPHIAYCSANEEDLIYASWNGSAWQHELVDALSGFSSGDPDLVLDALYRPHIAYSCAYPDFELRYAWNDGTGIAEGFEEADYNLSCGYLHPNPTTGITKLQFSLAADSHISVTIYDVSGHAVQIPESGQFTSGTHDMSFSVSSPGIYMMRITSEDQSFVRRFIVLD